MGIEVALAAVSIGVGAYSASKQMSAQKQQAAAQQESIAAQQRAEALRQKQMELDAQRRKREQIRAAISARSQALTNATNQGAAGTGSSGLLGGQNQIAAQSAVNIQGIEQNLAIGEGVFAANRDRLTADSRYASAGAQAQQWNAIGSLSNTILKNSATISKIGESLFAGQKKAA